MGCGSSHESNRDFDTWVRWDWKEFRGMRFRGILPSARQEGSCFYLGSQAGVRMKSQIPKITTDTIHSAFGFGTDIADAAADLMKYALVLVDEVCSLLDELFNIIMDEWTLVCMGDWWQWQPFDGIHYPCAGMSRSTFQAFQFST